MTLVKAGPSDFIQDQDDKCKDHFNGILQWEGGIGSTLDPAMGKWKFTAEEPGWVSGWKVTHRG